jgi:proteic killer suppression protein
MDIQFSDVKAAELFNTEKKLRGRYGAELAKAIMKRLADVEAVACLEGMRNLPGKWHELTGDYSGCIACRLSGNWRLNLKPAAPAPLKPDGGLNWKEVVTVRVVGVEDYH